MNTTIQKIYEKNYLAVELLEVQQRNIKFFLAKIKAKHLFKIFTVAPLEYDLKIYKALVDEYPDENEYYQDLIQRKNLNKLPDDFQRIESSERVKQIKKFIENDDYPLFPNTIIASCDLGNTFIDAESNIPAMDFMELSNETDPHSYIEKVNGIYKIYIPYEKNSLVIIDGQHRIRGLEEAKYDGKEDYELLISLLIGYGRSLVAHQFYTINYNQKPVNKSLLYQLMGQFSDELTRKTFFHGIVRMLNEIDSSPFYNRIKMLGVTNKDSSPEEKKQMTVSQAFLIDYFLPTVSDRLTNSIYAPIFYYYYKNEQYNTEVARFILKYFAAIRRRFKEQWNNPEQYILSKTNSIGAFIKIMHLIFVQIFIESLDSNPEKIASVSIDNLTKYFEEIPIDIFENEGEFGKGSSAGNLSKLKDRILQHINLFKGNSAEEKKEYYKNTLMDRYKDWFNYNCSDL